MQAEVSDHATAASLDAVRRIVRALRRSSRQAEQELGLSGAQLFVLQKLASADRPLALSELAELTLTHPSSVSVVVARLVERGFVLRSPSPEDGRRSEVRLAAGGRAFLERSSPTTAQEQLTRAIHQLPLPARTSLAELLNEVVTVAGFGGEDASMFFEERGEGST
jgi:DNA-binding MarR family transcriptional regulator